MTNWNAVLSGSFSDIEPENYLAGFCDWYSKVSTESSVSTVVVVLSTYCAESATLLNLETRKLVPSICCCKI